MTKDKSKTSRQQQVLEILQYLQAGGDFDTAKQKFQANFKDVDVAEITKAERELIANGLNPSEIQNLCNVHAAVFKGNIKQNQTNPDFAKPGHPVNTFKLENVVIRSLINDYLLPNLQKWLTNSDLASLTRIRQALKDLATIDKHYQRKEVSFFPIMNKYEITAPPKVMWGVDDDIRALIAKAITLSNSDQVAPKQLQSIINKVASEVLEMIFKEEEIMLPMIDEVASQQDWYNVKYDEKNLAFTLIAKPINWKPQFIKTKAAMDVANLATLFVNFQEGSLNLQQLSAILNILPIALTFVDENDKVVYFGGTANIFPHSVNDIGNSVFSCHPVKSVPMVKKILHEFHEGKKAQYEFLFEQKQQQRSIYIRYYAVHDQNNKYLGCLEVGQDVTKIRNWEK